MVRSNTGSSIFVSQPRVLVMADGDAVYLDIPGDRFLLFIYGELVAAVIGVARADFQVYVASEWVERILNTIVHGKAVSDIFADWMRIYKPPMKPIKYEYRSRQAMKYLLMTDEKSVISAGTR